MIFVAFNQINKHKAKYMLTVRITSNWILRSDLNKWGITFVNYFIRFIRHMEKQKKAPYRLTTVTRRDWAKPRAKKMDETEVRTRKIEMDQEKIEYMNFAYNEEIIYWKKAALDRILNEREEKELVDLAPPKVLLIRKEKIEKIVNIDEIVFYLESMY